MAISSFEVRVPASTANLGAGFDCFGLALTDLYLTVRATTHADPEAPTIVRTRGHRRQSAAHFRRHPEAKPDLPRAMRHTARSGSTFSSCRRFVSQCKTIFRSPGWPRQQRRGDRGGNFAGLCAVRPALLRGFRAALRGGTGAPHGQRCGCAARRLCGFVSAR